MRKDCPLGNQSTYCIYVTHFTIEDFDLNVNADLPNFYFLWIISGLSIFRGNVLGEEGRGLVRLCLQLREMIGVCEHVCVYVK